MILHGFSENQESNTRMIMRITIRATLLLLLVPSLLFPEPKSPVEPKAPELRDAVDQKGRDGGKRRQAESLLSSIPP